MAGEQEGGETGTFKEMYQVPRKSFIAIGMPDEHNIWHEYLCLLASAKKSKPKSYISSLHVSHEKVMMKS